MSAEKALKDKLSHLIPKNHFASISLFRKPPLINWSFTKAVLFTSYDIYRSSDYWLDSILKKGQTLKEGLIELGFPKENALIADTGIFEIEARKAGIAKEFGITPNINLSNKQIFEAYEVSGADYFVSPDEIILATDSSEMIASKVRKIKDNMLALLEIVDPKQVIGVIQGSSKKVISDIFDFYTSHGVEIFAAGGVIPLYKYDKDLFKRTLKYIRRITKGHWLHTFGLPRVYLLPFYLAEIGMNSVDTSMLLYMTARRRYLSGLETLQVRKAKLQNCNCEGCKALNKGVHPRSVEFFVALYTHNIIQGNIISNNPEKYLGGRERRKPNREAQGLQNRILPEANTNSSETSWKTACETLRESIP